MKNFSRALRIATRYRWTLAALVFSSLAVAVFWGGNLGTVYPIVGVVLKQRSLHDWIDDSIRSSTERRDSYLAQIARLEGTGSADNPLTSSTRREIAGAQAQLKAEETALEYSLRLEPWIKRYMPQKPFPTLVVVVGALLLGTFLKTLFLVTSVVLVERLTQLVAFDLRKLLYRRTLRMNLAHFGQQRTSTLLSHFTHDMEGITAGVRTIFGRAIREPLKIVACLLGAAFICWRLLLFCLIVTPITIYLISRLAQSVKRANRRAMDDMAGVYSHLSESFHGIQVVKSFTMERHERRQMHLRAKEYLRKSMRIAVYTSLTKPCTELMSIGVVCLAILTGGYLVLSGDTHLFGMLRMSYRPLSFELLMTFFALLAGVSDPFRKLAEVYNQVQRGAAAADRVYALVDRQPELRQSANPVKQLPPLRCLSLQEIDFAYRPDRPVLRGVSLDLQFGRRVAIVGPNGCGKTSLINLIPRFYDPENGQVCWNEIDLRDTRLRDLRGRIGIVSQQSLLFDDTVLKNISYGRPQATEAEIIAAAKQAHAHRFIVNTLSDGYDTVVGQAGKLLSGGQRQRIALARAILRDPEVLILDEATSQIDIQSEQLIHQALEEFTKGRTTVMITHRLSTLDLADQVVVMDEGRIVDTGTHSELLGRCPLYRRLNQIQFRESA